MKTCLRCGFTGQTTTSTPGHFALELVLWLCFFVPGFIYSVWRLTARHQACARCGSGDLIPADSPAAGGTQSPPRDTQV